MVNKQKVFLVPFDATSAEHRHRYYLQRVACGWAEDQIAAWSKMQLTGEKTTFWVVLGNFFTSDQQETMIAQHLEKHPAETIPLKDSATTLGAAPRAPSGALFVPIGHVAVQPSPEATTELGFAPVEDFWWITSLYISHAIQRGGLGRATMGLVEAMLLERGAKTILIDTTSREACLTEKWLQWRFESRGHTRPADFKTNEDWYIGQGYTRFAIDKKGYPTPNQETGEIWWVQKVYLKKEVHK